MTIHSAKTIDVHSHADGQSGARDGLRAPSALRRSAPNLVSQGHGAIEYPLGAQTLPLHR